MPPTDCITKTNQAPKVYRQKHVETYYLDHIGLCLPQIPSKRTVHIFYRPPSISMPRRSAAPRSPDPDDRTPLTARCRRSELGGFCSSSKSGCPIHITSAPGMNQTMELLAFCGKYDIGIMLEGHRLRLEGHREMLFSESWKDFLRVLPDSHLIWNK